MKKLLSLSLAIIMMLSCVLVQTVAVSAAEAVSYTNAPYAGVYEVTSDKAVTLTNETGHKVTLAAGATDYFYLIKGNNLITSTDASANVTFTALEGNGMDYINEVEVANLPLTDRRIYFGRPSDGETIGSYVSSKDDSVTVAANNSAVTIPAGASVTLKLPVNQKGIWTFGIDLTSNNNSLIYIETDTGFYGEIQQTIVGTNETHKGTTSDAQVDVEQVYLREGDNYVTITNKGTGDAVMDFFRVYHTSHLTTYSQYNWALSYEHFKVVVAETSEPEDTPTVGVTNYTADLAGVYEVTADKAVTITSEIGSVAELEADETGYIYLLKGANILNVSDISANITITALENNGLDYLDQVTAEIPLAPSSISELDLSGNFTNAQGSYNDYGAATGVAFDVDASVDVTLNAPAAGLYVVQIQFASDNQAQMTVETDTGFYGVINQIPGRTGWNELHSGTYESELQDLEPLFLRAGENTITFKNTGSDLTLVKKIKLAKTGSLATLPAYNWQLNVENLKTVAPVVDSFINDNQAVVAGSTITMSGRIGAEWMDKLYGVEFAANKAGTRAQKYYGAKSGDKVAADETATSTTTFTFGEWDGTFEIVLQGVSAGVKEYRFFVGDNYTDAATVEVVAE